MLCTGRYNQLMLPLYILQLMNTLSTGHDEINIHGVKEHESYRGDRTQASLTTFADTLVPSAGQPHHYIRCSASLPLEHLLAGCALRRPAA